MFARTVLTACLHLLFIAGFGIYSAAALITCEAGNVVRGETASVTCSFRAKATDTKRGLSMALYPPGAPRGHRGTDVLICSWSETKQKHDCLVEHGYTFDDVITDHLTVKVPAASDELAGFYKCFFLPDYGIESIPCELTVQAKPAGEREKGADMLLIILTTTIGSVVVCGILALFIFLHRRRLKRERGRSELTEQLIPLQRRQLETFLEGFQISKQALHKVMQLLEQEMSKGLDQSTKHEADVKMFHTFVSHLPTDSRNGQCLVLSFDHSNLRVFLMELQEHNAQIQFDSYPIRPNIKMGTSKQLFAFIADSTKKFIMSHDVADEKLPLALVVAFPCKHESLEKGRLVKWTKEFNNKKVVDEDLYALLHDNLKAKRTMSAKVLPGRRFHPLGNLEIVAVVNDTVSTLVSVAHRDSGCKIGLMVDSGLNACYVEDWKDVEIDSPEEDKPQEMIINTELGALGEKVCLDFCRTDYDRELDEHSSIPGDQILEKMVGSVYIGEIVRLTLEKLTKEGLLFRAVSLSCALFQRDRFITDYVMLIEEEAEGVHVKTAGVLNGLGVLKHTDEDLKTVQRVCKLVCERAAFLAAASLATLVNRINQPEVTVVVDGYIYRRHPRFQDLINSKTRELVNTGLKFKIVSPEVEGTLNANNQPNPSGSACAIGAARIVAAALRSRNTGTASTLSKDGLDGTLPAEKDSVKSPTEIEKQVA